MKLLVLNPTAGGGRARERWHRIEFQVRTRLPDLVVREPAGPEQAEQIVREALERGVTDFVAAGGDGMVNLLISTIAGHLPPGDLPRVRFGAVGLGSSNDFHKPLREDRMLGGIPCRLDFDATVPHDVCTAALGNDLDGGAGEIRFWIINASVGITAEANHFFNNPNRLLRLLKRSSTGLGITYAALRTIRRFEGHALRLRIEGTEWSERVLMNLGIVKNPHFSGRFRYDSLHMPASGDFHVHMLGALSLPATLRTLAALSRNRFSGRPGTHTLRARELEFSSTEPFAVELDGEVMTARHVRMGILPERIGVCT